LLGIIPVLPLAFSERGGYGGIQGCGYRDAGIPALPDPRSVLEVSDVTTRHCTKCETTKWRDDFFRDSSCEDGWTIYCKTCITTWGPTNEAQEEDTEDQDMGT